MQWWKFSPSDFFGWIHYKKKSESEHNASTLLTVTIERKWVCLFQALLSSITGEISQMGKIRVSHMLKRWHLKHTSMKLHGLAKALLILCPQENLESSDVSSEYTSANKHLCVFISTASLNGNAIGRVNSYQDEVMIQHVFYLSSPHVVPWPPCSCFCFIGGDISFVMQSVYQHFKFTIKLNNVQVPRNLVECWKSGK